MKNLIIALSLSVLIIPSVHAEPKRKDFQRLNYEKSKQQNNSSSNNSKNYSSGKGNSSSSKSKSSSSHSSSAPSFSSKKSSSSSHSSKPSYSWGSGNRDNYRHGSYRSPNYGRRHTGSSWFSASVITAPIIYSAPRTTYYYEEPALGYYDSPSGNVTYDVQVALARYGYAVGAIDGIMGSRTRNAISDFQYDRGLRVTGRIDEILLRELGLIAYN